MHGTLVDGAATSSCVDKEIEKRKRKKDFSRQIIFAWCVCDVCYLKCQLDEEVLLSCLCFVYLHVIYFSLSLSCEYVCM